MDTTTGLFDRERLAGYDPQLLNQAYVAVVGLGAAGCNIVQTLALSGVGNLGLVDFDVVEASNLTRSPLFDRRRLQGQRPRFKAREAALGALAGLSAPAQDLLWFSDEDDFVADHSRIRAATNVIGRVGSHFLAHSLGHLRFGTTKCDDGSRSIEDLGALPDLAAGALTEVLSDANGISCILQETPHTSSIKARYILSWLGDTVPALKKVTCVLSPGDQPHTLKSQWIRLYSRPALVETPARNSILYKASIFGRIP